MTTNTSTLHLLLIAAAGGLFIAACGSGGTDPVEQDAPCCKQGDPHTDFAPCASDDDCFSGWCNPSAQPPNICETPTYTAYAGGHGYSCQTDADCVAVAPDLAARGAIIKCHVDNGSFSIVGCQFECYQTPPTTCGGAPPGSGSGGGGFGTSTGPGAGGTTVAAGSGGAKGGGH